MDDLLKKGSTDLSSIGGHTLEPGPMALTKDSDGGGIFRVVIFHLVFTLNHPPSFNKHDGRDCTRGRGQNT